MFCVSYLKNINTFLTNNICILKSKLSKELKSSIEILVDHVVFKFGSKQPKYCLINN